MCGVVVILSRDGISKYHTSAAKKTLELLKHRGPDSQNIWTDGNNGVIIGHARLSIIDLSNNASQPMKKNKVVISFNGELYNYKEIRKTLEYKGHVFRSESDTEVVLESWLEWGDKCFSKFDGMFAVAIWDGERLTLGSDPLGEKTLYYTQTSFGWVVCSELPVLKRVFELSIQLDSEKISSFMALGYITAPSTAFKNTYRLMPAEIVSLYKNKPLCKKIYWKIPEFSIHKGRAMPLTEQQLDSVADKILVSLKRRLVSDVPVCLFLSAGVDSSLVAALAKKELHQDIDCVTVTFKGGESSNEAIQAKELSDFLGLKLQNVIIDSSDNKSLARSVINHFGQPFESMTSLAISTMTHAVSDKYKVGLTGFGGDEVFAGYGKHNFVNKYKIMLNMHDYPTSILRGFDKLSGGRINATSSLFGLKRYQKYIALKNYPLFPLLKNIQGFDQWVKSSYPPVKNIELEVYIEELKNVLPNSRCISVDLGSMKSSMELRTPFLNKDLIELLSTYNYRSMTSFGQKSILRNLLKRYVPDSLVDRPKQGFSFPKRWLIDQEKYNNTKNSLLPENFNTLLKGYGSGRNYEKMTTKFLILSEFLKEY